MMLPDREGWWWARQRDVGWKDGDGWEPLEVERTSAHGELMCWPNDDGWTPLERFEWGDPIPRNGETPVEQIGESTGTAEPADEEAERFRNRCVAADNELHAAARELGIERLRHCDGEIAHGIELLVEAVKAARHPSGTEGPLREALVRMRQRFIALRGFDDAITPVVASALSDIDAVLAASPPDGTAPERAPTDLRNPNEPRARSRADCEIIEGFMPKWRDATPIVAVRVAIDGREYFLRHSKGPLQGHFLDMYPDDYQRRDLAELAIAMHLNPPRIDVTRPPDGTTPERAHEENPHPLTGGHYADELFADEWFSWAVDLADGIGLSRGPVTADGWTSPLLRERLGTLVRATADAARPPDGMPGEPAPRDMLRLLFDARASLDKLPSTNVDAHAAWCAVQECISRCTPAAPTVPGEPPPPVPFSEPIASIIRCRFDNVQPDGESAEYFRLEFKLADDYDYLEEAEAALAKHIAIVQGGTAICQRCQATAAPRTPPLTPERAPAEDMTEAAVKERVLAGMRAAAHQFRMDEAAVRADERERIALRIERDHQPGTYPYGMAQYIRNNDMPGEDVPRTPPLTPERAPLDEAAVRADERGRTERDIAQAMRARTAALAISRDRATASSRHTVAHCRQSDIETLEGFATTVESGDYPRRSEGAG